MQISLLEQTKKEGNQEMMKACIYCRVSTEDQEREGTSLQTQREACSIILPVKRLQRVSQLY